MKQDELKKYPEEIIDQFLHRPITCPYHQGKMQLTKITKRSKEKIVHAIKSLRGSTFSHLTYDELLAQNNQEKSMEYQLSHEVVTPWIAHAYEFLEPEIPPEIGLYDMHKIAFISAEEGMHILSEMFARVNLHLQTHHPEVYALGDEYGILKKELAARGCRKAQQGAHLNVFDQFTEDPIRAQLVVQTIPYIQYLLQTHRDNKEFMYGLKEAKAPKSWYFLADLGHLIRLVRSHLPGGEHLPGGKDTPGGELYELYDEQEKYGISQEARAHLEKFMERFSSGSFNHKAYEALHGSIPKNRMFPDEPIHGCPVKDSFTKFFRITVSAFYHAVQEKE